MKLAERIKKIKPSPTLSITAKANAMIAKGMDVIGFGAGEPDFDTPVHIKNAAIKAIEGGFTKYTPVGGIDELKDAIIHKFARENGLDYKKSEIVVSCGAKHTLYNIAQVLFEEGDEVLIPSPYWVSYIDIVVLTGAKPVIIETRMENGFKMKPEDLKRAITNKTKAIIINSPSNPAGVLYNEEELKAFAEILFSNNIIIISDDVYEQIIYDGQKFFNVAMVNEEIRAKTILVNAVSKTYAMTGWRIGYAAGPEEIIAAATKLQSQNTSNPTSISQKAAVEALLGPQESVAMMKKEFERRRNFIVHALNEIPGVICPKPQGAFYVFPNFSAYYGKKIDGREITNSAQLTDFLLEEAKVAVVPGGEFGMDGHLRFSYATSIEKIERGVQRIKEALTRIS